MPDEITFMDLASIQKITPNTPLEKLGSALNASIFDASNMAGTLKQKGLIEFTANYPGPNAITITEAGKALIQEADSKSTAPIDPLDESILTQLSGGKRIPTELQNTLGIRPRDLAMRLYKLNKQGLIIYELKNGGVELLLTEQGFLRSKGGMMQKPATASPTMAQQPFSAMPPPMQPGMASPEMQAMQTETSPPMQPPMPADPFAPPHKPGMKAKPIIAAVVIIVIIVVLVLLYYKHII